MATPNDIIAKAKSQIGVKESPMNSNNVKYNTWYYGGAVKGSDFAWCAVFINWIFKECGASSLYYGGQKTAYCPTLMSFYKQKGQFSTKAQKGAIVFYDWNKNGSPDHVGIVESVNADGSITAIEGNTAVGNDSNGGEVMRRTRYKSQILGYAYPYTAGTKTTNGGEKTVTVTLRTLRKGSKGENVKALQILLIGRGCSCGSSGADGDFGSGTDKAVRDFQKKMKLGVDGVVGAQTWAALLK